MLTIRIRIAFNEICCMRNEETATSSVNLKCHISFRFVCMLTIGSFVKTFFSRISFSGLFNFFVKFNCVVNKILLISHIQMWLNSERKWFVFILLHFHAFNFLNCWYPSVYRTTKSCIIDSSYVFCECLENNYFFHFIFFFSFYSCGQCTTCVEHFLCKCLYNNIFPCLNVKLINNGFYWNR